MTKKKILSAVAPSGNITLGNYIGAISQWVQNQENPDSENWFFVVDLHAMTMPYEPRTLREKTLEVAMLYLACGIDPAKSNIFVQSHVPAHAELTWILNCNTPLGWMNQMIQFKEKSKKVGDENVSVGLYDYPVLMAADILLYNIDLVPVGEDQRQHVEIAREIARRFNRLYGNIFVEPEATNPPRGARTMALDDPSVKMSKSAKSKYNYIWLLDKPDDIRLKFSRAVTDSEQSIKFDQTRAGLYNLLNIYQILTGWTEQQIEEKFAGRGYGELKADLAERTIALLQPIQKKYEELDKNRDYVLEVLAHGAAKAALVANETLKKVKKKIGLVEPLSVSNTKSKPVVSFEDWLKLDVEIGTIKSVNEVAGADKLYQIALDFGESGETTIIAGIREYYRPSELVGKQVPILKNLAEKEIKGVKSKGMILAVNNGGEAIILSPQKEAKSGSKVS